MPVNVPPVGAAVPPPYGTAVTQNTPWSTLPSNIGAYINSKNHLGPKAWGFGVLVPLPLASGITLGAGLTGSAISASIILPQACKIPKVGIAYKTVDTFAGAETFNIVVESAGDYNPALSPTITAVPPVIYQPSKGGNVDGSNQNGTPFGAGTGLNATYTAGQAQTVGPGDDTGFFGYPTQFAAVGNCLFGTDVPFSPTTFTNPSAGTTGGGQVLVPTQWDTIYCGGSVLSLRAVTTASTGSVTALSVVLLCQLIDTRPSNNRPVPCYGW